MKKQVLALATIFTLGAGGFASNSFAAEHKIQPGETLAEISKQYSMTVEDLKKLNDLNSDLIIANESLNVLGENDFYTIKPGDTLFEIGLAKSATVDQLMKWNNLSSDLIYAGERLAVTQEAGKVRMEEQKPATQAKEQAQPKQQQQAQAATQPKQQAQATQKSQQQAAKPAAKQESQAKAPASAGKTYTMVATAYTAYCEGCSGITANGTNLRANPGLKVIAVDPKVIPLGTKVWVEGYGEAIAADTGGAIKGNKIDVFIPSKSDAYKWGRKTVQVKILN